MFALELAFVLAVAPRKAAALRAHWLDAAIVIVTAPLYASLLSSLRLLRLVRLMRFARASIVVARAVQAERRLTTGNKFRLVALATIFLVVMAGAVQAEVNAGEFESLWDGIWWAVVTVSTVGYGDLYPTSVSGPHHRDRAMMLGIGFLGCAHSNRLVALRQGRPKRRAPTARRDAAADRGGRRGTEGRASQLVRLTRTPWASVRVCPLSGG